MTTLDNLPDDILYMITNELSPIDIRNLVVNRNMKHFIESNYTFTYKMTYSDYTLGIHNGFSLNNNKIILKNIQKEDISGIAEMVNAGVIYGIDCFIPGDKSKVDKLSINDYKVVSNVYMFRTPRTFICNPSVFANVKVLDLSNTYISDVSALGSAHTLNLHKTLVRQVASLSNIHTLNLSETLVTDVSALGSVRNLNLSWTRVTDTSALGKVTNLNLSNTNITDVSTLGNVHTLNLSGTRVTNVLALGKVHTLDLSGTRVTNISSLGNVYDLNICHSRRIIVWPVTKNNKKVRIYGYEQYQEVLQVGFNDDVISIEGYYDYEYDD